MLNKQISCRKNRFRKIVVDSFNIAQKRKYHFLKNRAILWYALSRAIHKNRTSQVRFSPSKPDLIRPKNTYLIVIGFLQAFIELWKSHDRLHGIPGDNLARASRKGVKNPCRENGIHRIPPTPASMTACWKCAFRFPALGSASGRRTHRKSWNA